MSRRVPLVSILMPVHNAGAHLQETLDSIFAQTFEDFELIAVNDGSTDESLDILSSISDPRFALMRLSRPHGHGVAHNYGMKWVRGKYVAIHDADDLSHPERLARQVDFLEHERTYVGVGSCAQEFGDRSNTVNPPAHPEAIRLHLLFDNCLVHASMMLRTGWLRDNAIEYPDSPVGPDYGYFSRIARAGAQLSTLPFPLYRYRIHGTSISSTRALEREAYVASVRMDALAAEGLEFSANELELMRRERRLPIVPAARDRATLATLVRKLMGIRTMRPDYLRQAVGVFLVSLFERPRGTAQRMHLLYQLASLDARIASAFLKHWLASRL